MSQEQPISNDEQRACAQKLVEQLGVDAPAPALANAQRAVDDGDIDGALIWHNIHGRVTALLRPKGATN
jgi:hypothetical protein